MAFKVYQQLQVANPQFLWLEFQGVKKSQMVLLIQCRTAIASLVCT